MESINEIRSLLKRFYDGSSTKEEEELLSRFFSSGDVPEDLAPERELFSLFSSCEGNVEAPSGLDLRLSRLIDTAARKDHRTRQISLFSLSGLAAGLMIILAVYLVYLKDESGAQLASVNYTDTYDDPVQAYEETMKALNYVSSRFNEGTRELKPLGQVSQSVQHIQPLSLINKGQKELRIIGKYDNESRYNKR